MPTKRRTHRTYRWLALVPPLGMLGGIPFVNRATPLVVGLPPLLAWMIAWILLTSTVMGVIYALDHRRESKSPSNTAS